MCKDVAGEAQAYSTLVKPPAGDTSVRSGHGCVFYSARVALSTRRLQRSPSPVSPFAANAAKAPRTASRESPAASTSSLFTVSAPASDP